MSEKIRFIVMIIVLFLAGIHLCSFDRALKVRASDDTVPAYQWQMVELTFNSNPGSFVERIKRKLGFGNPSIKIKVIFEGPGREYFEIPGFYDGGITWKVRFTPTVPGRWTYHSECSDEKDAGLHGKSGVLMVEPAQSDNLIYQHGGILRVSDDKHYLAYSDGTPFFWLGDTWWWAPSDMVPFDGSSNPQYDSMFKTLIDLRKSQGYTVVQWAFLGTINDAKWRSKPNTWTSREMQFWQQVDEYFEYANDAGIIPAIGLTFHEGMDELNLETWKELWEYVVARYGAYATTWFIVGEYSAHNVRPRIEKVLELGQFIKDIDPYKRAMTVHPWGYYVEEDRYAWDEPWMDFIMIQGAHRVMDVPPVSLYYDAYMREDTKPVLEAECNYEGIGGASDESVRLVAYRAIQAGSFGYTYGSHGLWYPTQNENDRMFADWGEPIPWWEAMKRPGGAQMQYLRACYEMVEWWKLTPMPDAITTELELPERARFLAKGEEDNVFVIYIPRNNPTMQAILHVAAGAREVSKSYSGIWFDPRTGETSEVQEELVSIGGEMVLPDRPSSQDWVLILKKQNLQ